MKNKPQSGQFVIEAILIIVIFAAVSLLISREFQNRGVIGRLVAQPWEAMSGMIATGQWMPSNEAIGQGRHPHQRPTTRQGDSSP